MAGDPGLLIPVVNIVMIWIFAFNRCRLEADIKQDL